MHKIKPIMLIALLLSGIVITLFPVNLQANAALPYTEINGTLNGANYTIRIPNPIENWNKTLVVYCHGYNHDPLANPLITATLAPLVNWMITNGYAFAMSSYGVGGVCIQEGVNSTYQLTQYVISNYNATGKVLLLGVSMGGNIALLLGEKYPNVYSGVLDLSGPKNVTEQYNLKMDLSTTQDDTSLAAKLQALNAPVPPAPYSTTVSPPLSNQLQALRNDCNQSATDIIAETGGTPNAVPKAYENISPVNHANISIPVITLHGTNDSSVPYSQSLEYKAAVAAQGKSSNYRLYSVTGAQHPPDSIMSSQIIPKLQELQTWSDNLNWTLIANGTAVKGYSNLTETVWQKNANLPPNGPYDKIGLHRLVKTGITPKAVVFINPGTYMSGEQLISNPTTSNFTLNENSSQAIYWANQGFDVYAIDYRTHFVPNTLNSSQLSFMQNWGWDQWISDIREAVLKTKDVSGAYKIFMAGMSFGGGATMNYVSVYGNQDLRGIILLDGGNATKNPTPTNTYNLTAALNQMNTTGTWALETPNLPGLTSAAPSGWLFLMKYASQNPSAPAQYPPGTPLTPPINPITHAAWNNITEWCGFVLNGSSTNIAGGFGNSSIDTLVMGRMDRYWPLKLNLESSAINDWTNNPDVTFDFDDNYAKITAPILGFTSELFGLSRFGPIGNGTASSDVTKILLPSYGHLDVFFGTYSSSNISKPALDWMTNHTPATLSVSVSPSQWITAGHTATLIATASGGVPPYTYQWYENGVALAGQLSNQAVIYKSATGSSAYFCRVTDSEGVIANSVSTTLIVDPVVTPTPAPTAKPIAIPTQAPTSTPTATPNPTPTQQPSATPGPQTFNGTQVAYAASAAIVIAIVVIAAVLLIRQKRLR